LHSNIFATSERVNRAYVGADHTNWDLNIDAISASLRSSVYRSTGFSPYFLCFGHNIVAKGQDYELLRNLDLLTDDVALKTPYMLQVARQQAKKKISESHASNARVYSLRS